MEDLIVLACSSCGGKLQITSDIDRFACMYCGQEFIVNRGTGIVYLKPVIDGIKKIYQDTNVIASEITINRIRDEIKEIENKRRLAIDRLCSFYFQPLSLVYKMALKKSLNKRIVVEMMMRLNDEEIEKIKKFSHGRELNALLDDMKTGSIVRKQQEINDLLKNNS